MSAYDGRLGRSESPTSAPLLSAILAGLFSGGMAAAALPVSDCAAPVHEAAASRTQLDEFLDLPNFAEKDRRICFHARLLLSLSKHSNADVIVVDSSVVTRGPNSRV